MFIELLGNVCETVNTLYWDGFRVLGFILWGTFVGRLGTISSNTDRSASWELCVCVFLTLFSVLFTACCGIVLDVDLMF